ncbi:MAG: geranylgeranyl reductase family protein [Candidatus Geothermarchaeales archaeon]
MDLSYDVVVVGAGPAGASAALRASQSGVDVLLIDRRREIGVPIQCGEYLPVPREIRDLLPKARHLAALTDVSRDVILNHTSRIRVVSPSGREYLFDLEAHVIDRSRFDKNLVGKAAGSGAEVWTNAEALGVEDEGKAILIKREGEEIRVGAGVLIAADGALSRIARSLGLDLKASPYNYSPTVQYRMGGVEVEPDAIEMYFGRDYAPGGFAWVIPRGGDVANVGLGIRSPFHQSGTSIHDYLQRFIERHPQASGRLKKGVILSKVGGVVPMGGPIPKTHTENALVVGDAAGHVMASNGGGVPPALICGDIAGETAAKKVLGEADLSLYEEAWRQEVGGELYTSLKIREMGDLAMRSDRLLEGALKTLGTKNIEEMLRVRLPSGLRHLYELTQMVKKHL